MTTKYKWIVSSIGCDCDYRLWLAGIGKLVLFFWLSSFERSKYGYQVQRTEIYVKLKNVNNCCKRESVNDACREEKRERERERAGIRLEPALHIVHRAHSNIRQTESSWNCSRGKAAAGSDNATHRVCHQKYNAIAKKESAFHHFGGKIEIRQSAWDVKWNHIFECDRERERVRGNESEKESPELVCVFCVSTYICIPFVSTGKSQSPLFN